MYRLIRISLAAVLVALTSPFLSSGAALAAEATVVGLRLGENNGATRFVIDINRKVEYKTLILADPVRIVIDLPEVDWRLGGAGAGQGRGLIAKYRYGLFRSGVSRLVLDMTGPAAIDRMFILEPQGKMPYRLVFDLKETDQESFAASVKRHRRATQQVRTATTAPPQLRSKPTRDRKTIVIDAGHGGVDPGNLGVIGVPEKTIVLSMSRAIKRAIESSSRYQVVLTRNRDVFVPLERRRQIAREADADLFISVHADSLSTKSARNRKVRGATVYTLSEKASDAEAAALAHRENKADLIAGVDLAGESDEVRSILIDLAQRETMNYSAQFANYLVPELKERIYLRKNSHRFAGFVVLKAPDVPSVLLEVGYLSNKQDARRLNSADGRQRISTAVAAAVRRYFESTTARGF